MYYPGGMKAWVSPVQWSKPHSISAPTQNRMRWPLHYTTAHIRYVYSWPTCDPFETNSRLNRHLFRYIFWNWIETEWRMIQEWFVTYSRFIWNRLLFGMRDRLKTDTRLICDLTRDWFLTWFETDSWPDSRLIRDLIRDWFVTWFETDSWPDSRLIRDLIWDWFVAWFETDSWPDSRLIRDLIWDWFVTWFETDSRMIRDHIFNSLTPRQRRC